MITYQMTNKLPPEQVLALYESVGWSAYTKDLDKLLQALENSLRVITAWEDEKLVGLIRGVGDGVSILYIQDILVQPMQQNQGIGRELMQRLLAEFPTVRQKVLLTEEAPDVRHFYEKCGFRSADHGQIVAFYRFD